MAGPAKSLLKTSGSQLSHDMRIVGGRDSARAAGTSAVRQTAARTPVSSLRILYPPCPDEQAIRRGDPSALGARLAALEVEATTKLRSLDVKRKRKNRDLLRYAARRQPVPAF